jgi:hypothetical protein
VFSSSNRTDACEAEAEQHERAGLWNLGKALFESPQRGFFPKTRGPDQDVR